MCSCSLSQKYSRSIPISAAHEATEDDEYDGYFIKKGEVGKCSLAPCPLRKQLHDNFVIGSILHDPEVYPNLDEFRPEPRRRD